MAFVRDVARKEGKVFVLMPFGTKPLGRGNQDFDWDGHWTEVISLAIKQAKMNPERADDLYGSTGPLIDRIWKGIQEAEIVIADLTDRNPNVLYELGLAHVIGKRIILLTMNAEDVPADLASLAQIRYSPEGIGLLKLVEELRQNLEAARMQPAHEVGFVPLEPIPTERVAATVVSVTRDFLTVRTADGRLGFLQPEDVTWKRQAVDLTRFKEGQQLDGVFVAGPRGERRYSLKDREESPWPKLGKEFPLEKHFSSDVVGVVRTGVFVRMANGIDGFLPQSKLPRDVVLDRGTEVEVYPVKIDPVARQVELRLTRVLSPVRNEEGGLKRGQQADGHIAKIAPRRDFVLVNLGDGRTGILHFRRMSDDFSRKLARDEIEIGLGVTVEVLTVAGGRIELRDLPEAPVG